MRSRRSRISLRISACTVTSSAVVGSSAISSFGSQRQRLGDHRPLALAARELVRVGVDAPLRVGDLDQRRAARWPARAPPCGAIAWWLRSISAIWNPTVYTGLSAVIGSWKITDDLAAADLAQRALRRCRRARWPPSLIEPRDATRSSAAGPSSDIAVVDLPEPDSPTIASTSPASSVERRVDRPPGTTCRRPRSRRRGRATARTGPSSSRSAGVTVGS